MIFPPNIPAYGDKTFRDKKCPNEFYEQVSLVNNVRPERWPTITHIENEGKRTRQQVFKAKMAGLTTGASDIIIPARITFVCELKRTDHTLCSISDEQIKYLLRAQSDGAFACIALGCLAAIEAIKEWERLLLKSSLENQS